MKSLPIGNKESFDENGRGVAREHCSILSSEGITVSSAFRILS